MQIKHNLLVKTVKVDLLLSPQQIAESTGRVPYFNKEILETVPRCKNRIVDVFFFPAGHNQNQISNEDLNREYENYNLVPVDFYSLAKVNSDDPTFADQYPNTTQWRNQSGKLCVARFFSWSAEKRIFVFELDRSKYFGCWWFGGVRKDIFEKLQP